MLRGEDLVAIVIWMVVVEEGCGGECEERKDRKEEGGVGRLHEKGVVIPTDLSPPSLVLHLLLLLFSFLVFLGRRTGGGNRGGGVG